MARSVAKIARPALKGVAARLRLFARLDQIARRHAITWVSAPAGSGKTTLAASWLAARARPCLWYQLDAGDADPATFFYYQREATRRLAPRRRETLPLLTPEYALGVAAYARHFFEALGARVPPGTVIVLDNYQDLPEDAPLQALLPQALSALPEGVRVLVLSRSAPPPSFARLITEGAVGFLETDELDLSAAETRALARARVGRRGEAAAANAVRAQTGGWVAGTVLLLEAPKRALPAPRTAKTSAQQVLFDYFASEIFDRAPADAQRLLLATAVLPEVTLPAARSLAAEPRAAEILADLVRRNYFTLRLAGPEPRYRYHPLFREFLLSRARRTVDGAGWRALAGRAAEILVREGSPGEAAEILSEAGAFDELANVVRMNAPLLARQGRLASVESWIRALPDAMVEEDPWLTYWLGLCRITDLTRARASFEAAYREFRARGDLTGAFLAWAGFVSTHLYVWNDFGPLDPWIAEMEQLCREIPAFPSIEIEALVASSMVASLMWRAPAHPEMRAWEGRALALLDSDAPPELRMQLAANPLFYRITWGDYPGSRQLIERVRPLLAAADVTPVTEMFWYVLEASYEARVGDGSACFAAVDKGLATATTTGVMGMNHLLAMQGVYGALAMGNLDSARRYHATAREHLGPNAQASRAHLLHLAAWIELCAGNLPHAEEHARASLADLLEAGPDLGRSWGEYTLAHVLIERGEYEEAVAFIDGALAWSRQVRNLFVEHDCLLALAYARSAQGRVPEGLEWLREALRLGSERSFITHSWMGWRRDVMSRLMALALAHGIEVEHVRRIIAARRLEAPEEAASIEAWPWPVRIRMLGPFELWREGERVSFTGKVQRKPLDLLRALVALGGVDVREEALVDVLWPDAEGDAAAHALETTVYRLRKLLGAPGAVVRQERRLSLDPRICWVDALALSRRRHSGEVRS